MIGASAICANPVVAHAERSVANENMIENENNMVNDEEDGFVVSNNNLNQNEDQDTPPAVTCPNVITNEKEDNTDESEVLPYKDIDRYVVGKTAAQVKKERLNKWIKTCEKMLRNMKKYRFRYSNSGGSDTYRGALKRSRRTNCALFASWCLQEGGAISKGNTFYMRGRSLHKDFKKWGNKVRVFRVNKRCSSAHLQKGDVVCWSSASHVNIYAGKSSSGKRLWIDGGKVATAGNHNGSRYVHTGARALSYLNRRKIAYIIRIRF